MCGLFGITLIGADEVPDRFVERARNARDTLVHRGPDQCGEYVQANVYQGHRRLSIIDLSERGRQPMTSEDGSISISVNGEIYNFGELRAQLGSDQFRSRSDSEVILHGYRTWGIAGLLERLEGMFAFSLHDSARGKVYLARDRPGIKPLYFGRVGDVFAWASELKALESFWCDSGRLTVDETALYDVLTYLYVPTPKSLYREIRKLEPAHWVELDTRTGQLTRNRYWSLEPSEEPKALDETVAQARDLLAGSVTDQLISDVDLGFFLSGGIDSSSVVSLAAGNGTVPRTFSIGYDDSDHDETGFAQIVADRWNTRHTREVLDPGDAADLRERMRGWYDEPFADTSALPTHHVSSLASRHSKVVLTGDGGDEVFGGYRWYRRFTRFRRAQAPLRALLSPFSRRGPRTAFARRSRGLVRKVGRRLDLVTYFEPLELYAMMLASTPWHVKTPYRRLLEVPDDYDDLWHFRKFDRPDLPPLKRLQYIDFHTYLPDDILTKVDRVSMAVSLEARVPFLSRSLIEFAFAVPERDLFHGGELKGLLKLAMKDLLPPEIIDRRKKGFSIPLHDWRSAVGGRDVTFQEHMVDSYL